MRLAAAAVALALVAGCGGGDPHGTVTVFAAASLREAFEQIAVDVEDAQPGLDVQFNFAGSQQLARQIVEGAPADVFASADVPQMNVAVGAGRVAEPVTFVHNRLAIVTEAGNPADIGSLADLADPQLKVVLAAEDVPAGRYARDVLDNAGVVVNPVSLEVDVRAVLSKVALGEADAGIVYATDVTNAADGVEQVDIPDDQNIVATYPIAVVDEAPNPSGAAEFVDAVRSDEGRAVLENHGFGVPQP